MSSAITHEVLIELGFDLEDREDDVPSEMYVHPSGLEVWDYNGEQWVVQAFDQHGIDHELRTREQLEALLGVIKFIGGK